MRIALLVVAFLMLAGCTKKVEGLCTSVQSINDLEVCQLSSATIILSKGGQTVFPREQPKPAATPEAAKPASIPEAAKLPTPGKEK